MWLFIAGSQAQLAMCPTTRFWCGLARKGSRLVAHSQIGDMAAANHSARQQEWAQLEINQPKPESRLIEDKSGEEWWLTPASPGHNTPFEHFVAVLVLFSWFGAMWAMPWTTLATVYFACKGNVIAWTVIAIMTGLSLLPAGKVGLHMQPLLANVCRVCVNSNT